MPKSSRALRRDRGRISRWTVIAAAALAVLAACGPAGDRAERQSASAATSRATATGGSAHDTYAANGFTCDACHPCGTKSPSGHTAPWMDTASSGFHAYSANASLASCQQCHGAALDGIGGSTSVSCARCHGATWKTSCTMCHGGVDGTTGAPPKATWGKGADAVRVGAHTAHVGAAHGLSAAIDCGACHVKPADALAPGHADGDVATVTFSGLATQGVAAAPSWDRAQATCASTYCHGATLSGGTRTTPAWTTLDGTQRACDACHGAPPPAPHVQNASCGGCHTGYTATTVNPATHVDGKIDVVPMTCTSCHGQSGATATPSAPNPAAPPVGTHGETATTARAVGAHQAHLAGGTLSGPIACGECHVVPTSTSHASGMVDVAFGALARSGGAVPTWNGTTCASTYCHGATLSAGGTLQTPTWTKVDGTQDACGTCHGAPPPAPHVQNASCGSCHSGYTSTSVNLSLHADGKLDVTTTCTSCHGAAGQAATAASPLYAAPPLDTAGASTSLRVGAHQKHLAGGSAPRTYSNGFPCATCHPGVGTYTTGHSNGTTEVTFTGAPSASMRKGAWTAGTPTTAGKCASTWCHGNGITSSGANAGGTLLTPAWNGAVTACTACHGAPPSTGRHTVSNHVSAGCGACHSGYSSSTVNRSLHVSGTRDVGGTGTRINSWNASTRTCSPSCHGTESW